MICRYSCLKAAGIHQFPVLRVLHTDIHKSDNSIQRCSHIMRHSGKKIRFTLVCLFLALQGNGFFHQFILVQNQIPVFDHPIRFADLMSPVLNIFPGSIFAFHAVCDLIMIRFTILLQRLCNPLFQIIRMCQVSNRPSRSFHQFLRGIISQHLRKMLRNILKRIFRIIIADFHASRQCRCDHVQLMLKFLVYFLQRIFIKTLFLYDLIYTSETKERKMAVFLVLFYNMCLKAGQACCVG